MLILKDGTWETFVTKGLEIIKWYLGTVLKNRDFKNS